MQKPTRAELEEWQSSDTTRWVLERLRLDRKALSEVMETGGTIGPEVGTTAQLTARLVGEISGLDHILERDFTEYLEEVKDGN